MDEESLCGSLIEETRRKISRKLSIIRAGSHGLSHQPSILDLIDDTTLTSLPFPPPARTSSKRSTVEDESQERNSTEDYLNDNSCLRIPETVEDESFLDEDESEDPIVLVEDYMRTSNYTPSSGPITANAFTTFGVSIGSRNASATSSFSSTESRGSSRIQLQRKKSLAHFKLRLQLQRQGEQIVNQNRSEEGTDLETLSGCSDSSFIGHWNGNGSSNSNSNSTTNTISGRNKKANSTLEHLEGMWGKIPGSDNLKYCDLCEKPLYEISAILNKKNPKDGGESEFTATTSGACGIRYEEFVCEECIENYEEFFNELNELQLEAEEEEDFEKLEKRRKTERVCEIFKAIQDKYTSINEVKVSLPNEERITASNKRIISQDKNEAKRTKFSKNLLDKLHTLSGDEILRNIGRNGDWLSNIQQKLRWRWRINGLLPELVVPEQHSIK